MVSSGSILVENLVALLIIMIAILILAEGVSSGLELYVRLKSRYIAELTAENVYHILLAGESVPKEMNGFDVRYEIDGNVLRVWVGSRLFVYGFEVSR